MLFKTFIFIIVTTFLSGCMPEPDLSNEQFISNLNSKDVSYFAPLVSLDDNLIIILVRNSRDFFIYDKHKKITTKITIDLYGEVYIGKPNNYDIFSFCRTRIDFCSFIYNNKVYYSEEPDFNKISSTISSVMVYSGTIVPYKLSEMKRTIEKSTVVSTYLNTFADFKSSINNKFIYLIKDYIYIYEIANKQSYVQSLSDPDDFSFRDIDGVDFGDGLRSLPSLEHTLTLKLSDDGRFIIDGEYYVGKKYIKDMNSPDEIEILRRHLANALKKYDSVFTDIENNINSWN